MRKERSTQEGLRTALEIALDKHNRYQDLSGLMAEIYEHVALLEECWDAIGSPTREQPEVPAGQPTTMAA